MNKILILRENPQLAEKTAYWFSTKWNVPFSEYRKSIAECIEKKSGIPQWYVVVNEEGKIIAGAGLIENDFHSRTDLTPNVCALFVEEPYRLQGIARELLDFIRTDGGKQGYDSLYLVTDHENFYEKCGWTLFGMIKDDDGNMERMYTINNCMGKCGRN